MNEDRKIYIYILECINIIFKNLDMWEDLIEAEKELKKTKSHSGVIDQEANPIWKWYQIWEKWWFEQDLAPQQCRYLYPKLCWWCWKNGNMIQYGIWMYCFWEVIGLTCTRWGCWQVGPHDWITVVSKHKITWKSRFVFSLLPGSPDGHSSHMLQPHQMAELLGPAWSCTVHIPKPEPKTFCLLVTVMKT